MKEDESMTTEEECVEALNFLKKKRNDENNLNAERNPCVSLSWWMWEKVDESRAGRRKSISM